MKHVTVTLVTQEDGKVKSAVLSGNVGDLGSDKVDQFFVSDLRTVLNEIDPLTGTGSTTGIVADTCTAQPYDYLAEDKRRTLSRLLIEIGQRTSSLTAEEAAEIVNQGYAALENHTPIPDLGYQTQLAAGTTVKINGFAFVLMEDTPVSTSKGGCRQVNRLQNDTSGAETGQMTPAPETAQDEAEQTEGLSFSQALNWIRRGYAVAFSDMVDLERVYMVKLKGKGDRDYIVYNDGHDTIDSKWRPSHRHMLNDEWRVLLEPR